MRYGWDRHTEASLKAVLLGLSRYTVAAAGPIASAVAQFALSLILLRHIDARAFGSFSFLLVISQFGLGVFGALFCAPLPIMSVGTADTPQTRLVRQAMFAMSLLCAAAGFAIIVAIGVALGQGWFPSILFGIFSSASLLRWFARARAYVAGEPMRTLASDLLYSAAIAFGAVVTLLRPDVPLVTAYAALAIGATIALFPFGHSYLTEQFSDIALHNISRYRAVWIEHSRWSLVGVLTTEATANAHVYIVTLVSGPAGYAAIAASALLIRPITVAQNALGEFERARMARQIATGDIAGATAAAGLFRLALIAAWIGTAAASAILLIQAPRLIFPAIYPVSVLAIGGGLWLVVALIRLLRTPDSIVLQAAGAFRSLAFASVVSCGFSIVAVLVILVLAGPLWSIAGVFAGELVFAIWIWRQLRRWRTEQAGA